MSAIRIIDSTEELKTYEQFVRNHRYGNFWQSIERMRYEQACGRDVKIYVHDGKNTFLSTAMVMIDKTAGGFTTWEIPRGPLGDSPELMKRITDDAKASMCLALYVSPYEATDTIAVWKLSERPIYCEATRMIDLTKTEDEILVQMKQKGRYNIKVAQKNNVIVEQSQDIDAFHAIVKITGERDAFGTLPLDRYKKFMAIPNSFLLMAYEPTSKKPIAGVMGVLWNKTAIYYYGASDHAYRNLMAPYLLQWEAMRHAKAHNCTLYDLLGVAPADAVPDHPWSGITRFKEQFGGELITYPPEKMVVMKPMVNMLLKIKRRILG